MVPPPKTVAFSELVRPGKTGGQDEEEAIQQRTDYWGLEAAGGGAEQASKHADDINVGALSLGKK